VVQKFCINFVSSVTQRRIHILFDQPEFIIFDGDTVDDGAKSSKKSSVSRRFQWIVDKENSTFPRGAILPLIESPPFEFLPETLPTSRSQSDYLARKVSEFSDKSSSRYEYVTEVSTWQLFLSCPVLSCCLTPTRWAAVQDINWSFILPCRTGHLAGQ
jgi:hypothetical protein